MTDNERGIPAKWMGLDVGPKTRANNSEVIARAKTVLWNGPLGVYEMGPFGGGTISAFWDLVAATKRGATTIIGGGDTGSASKFFYCVSHSHKEMCEELLLSTVRSLISFRCSSSAG